MKAWSVIGLLFTGATIATIPVSAQVTPRGVELSVDRAQAIQHLPPHAGRLARAGRLHVDDPDHRCGQGIERVCP